MPSVEPVTPTTPRPLPRAWITQRWRHVAFAHWAVEPDAVRRFMPPGIEVDTLDGVSHVGLIGFRMVGAGAFGVGMPLVGSFWETNVRLYSVDDRGRRGVVFVTLDASRLAAVLGARIGFGLPYAWSRMSVARSGDEVAYRGDRILFGPRPARSALTVRIRERIARPTPLELWLTARWGLHVARAGEARYLPNEHPAWSLHRAELVGGRADAASPTALEDAPDAVDRSALDIGALDAVGIDVRAASGRIAAPSSVLYSPGVPVRFGRALPA